MQNTPQAEEEALDLAVDLHQAGRLQEAEAAYKGILAANPNHTIALQYLALLAHQCGNTDAAIDLFKKVISLDPDYTQAYCNLANTLIQVGRPSEAEPYFRTAIDLEPDRWFAHVYLGKSLLQLERFDEAIASCEAALALDPDLADAHEITGNAHEGLGQVDKAVESYRTATALSPDISDYQDSLGQVLYQLDRFDEAEEAFQRAVSIDPDQALLHNNLGGVYYTQRKLDAAMKSYQNAIAADPDCALAHQNIANVYRDIGRKDETIAHLQKALELDPTLTSPRHNLDALLGQTTETAPREYVEELFDEFANRFETYLQDKLEYSIPALMKTRLVDLGLTESPFKKVVDLGCGTGLAGVAVRDIADTLIGIDLSKNMVQKAEAKDVYDQLYVDDLVDGLQRLGGDIDLFLCTDTFVYIGNLEASFKAVQKSAAPNAVFVFSTEHLETGESFVLQNTSRYAHPQVYIQALADQFGFEVVHFEKGNLRKEKDGWIIGGLYVLKC